MLNTKDPGEQGYKEQNNLMMLDTSVQSSDGNQHDEHSTGDSAPNNRPTCDQGADFRICWHCYQNKTNYLLEERPDSNVSVFEHVIKLFWLLQ